MINTVMRIDELINPPVSAKTAFNRKQLDHIDSGYQAQVYQHPRDPNKVIKTVDIGDPEADAYVDFIKLAMKQQDNPHFPRIFSAKMYRKHADDKTPETEWEEADDMGDYRLVIVMEKLHSVIDEKLEDAAMAAFENVGIPNRIAAASMREPSVLSDYIEHYYDASVAEHSSHVEAFVRAYRGLERYIDEHGQDMHSRNFMLRLTGTGPQLVLIDPLNPSFI